MKKKSQSESGQPMVYNDNYGFPDPGNIIKQYRENLTYPDQEKGKLRHWTQADLAKRLGVSEITVRQMENTNKGLDSIERRRVLADILKIPPALLGLAIFPDALADANGMQIKSNIISHIGQPEQKNIGLTQLYGDVFRAYSETYAAGSTRGISSALEDWLSRLQNEIAHISSSQRLELLPILWEYHALLSRVYCDAMAWDKSFSHINAALEIATSLDSADLQASSLYRSAAVHFVQRNVLLAKSDLDGALIYAKAAKPHIKGTILLDAGLAYATVYSDRANATYAQSLLDQAEQLTGKPVDDGVMNFDTGKYLLRRARALIALDRPGKALEYLDDAEEKLLPSQRLKLAFVNIARADAYMKLKQPEYDMALYVLNDAFSASKAIQSEFNIGHVRSLYSKLAKSPYGTSPDVADLGLALRDWYKPR